MNPRQPNPSSDDSNDSRESRTATADVEQKEDDGVDRNASRNSNPNSPRTGNPAPIRRGEV